MVGVNVGVPVPREPFSFGGWNESKFGAGDITGRGSIEFWTRAKKTTTQWNREAGAQKQQPITKARKKHENTKGDPI
jgi:malonate-semialdehyde dehydrogenase (acetylating) / methylmalonate-semialdehyde dehydrogenase